MDETANAIEVGSEVEPVAPAAPVAQDQDPWADQDARIARLFVSRSLTKWVEYVCTNSDCRGGDDGKSPARAWFRYGLHNDGTPETMLEYIICWYCHKGLGLSRDDQHTAKAGMKLVRANQTHVAVLSDEDHTAECERRKALLAALPHIRSRGADGHKPEEIASANQQESRDALKTSFDNQYRRKR